MNDTIKIEMNMPRPPEGEMCNATHGFCPETHICGLEAGHAGPHLCGMTQNYLLPCPHTWPNYATEASALAERIRAESEADNG